MEKVEKKLMPDLLRENEYAREELRLAELLKKRLSEGEIANLIFELEKLAKENDNVVAKILSHPKIIENYDVDAYDGLELKIRPPLQLPVYFMKDGLWKMRHLDESNLLADSFARGESYDTQALLDWFREDLSFNKLRLQQLQKTGSIMITDPTKVRIKKIDLGEDTPQDKEEADNDKKTTIN